MPWEDLDAETLFRACADASNSDAWAEFIRRYGALIERTVLRVSRRWKEPSSELLDDLMQETYVKLCTGEGSALRAYNTLRQDSDFGFIKVFTANVVLDYFRRSNAQRRSSMATVPLASVPEPETTDMIDQVLVLKAIDDCLDRIATGQTRDRDRSVFYLYYKQGFSAQAISQLPSIGLTREGVESLLGRLTRALRSNLVLGDRGPGARRVENRP